MGHELGLASDFASVAQSCVDRRLGVGAVGIGDLGRLKLNLDERFCHEVADVFEAAPLFTWNAELGTGYRYSSRRAWSSTTRSGRPGWWSGLGRTTTGPTATRRTWCGACGRPVCCTSTSPRPVAESVAAGAETWASFVCGPGARLLSGEPLAEAAQAAEAEGAALVLVNCTRPDETEQCLAVLREACAGPIGAYPNVEDRSGLPDRTTHVDGAVDSDVGPEEFAALAARWRTDSGLSVLGGCCGTTPAHVAAARDALAAATTA